MRRGRASARAVALSLTLWLSGCGPAFGEAYLQSFSAAQRAQHSGRYEEAARLYAAAASKATRLKDRDEAYFMQAYMFERMRNYDRACRAYRELAARSPKGPRTARASYDAANLEAEHGDAEKGWAALRAALLKFPNHGLARHALELWVGHLREEKGEAAVQRELKTLLGRLRGTVVEQPIKYQLAGSWQQAGELERAHAQYLAAAREHPYPKGALTDDAYYRASEVAEQLGKPQQAIDDLRELLDAREVSGPGFSYERPRFPAAQLRIADIYLERLGDKQAARREYRRVYREHGDSMLADDAMWKAALISLELDDRDAACDVAKEIGRHVPASRYRRCMHELCGEMKSVEGERPCPPYLEKQITATGS